MAKCLCMKAALLTGWDCSVKLGVIRPGRIGLPRKMKGIYIWGSKERQNKGISMANRQPHPMK